MAKKAKIPGQESVEEIIRLMKKHQPCNAKNLYEYGCKLKQVSINNLLGQLRRCRVIKEVDRVKSGKRYQLTGLSPLTTCSECKQPVLAWNLKDNKCPLCSLKAKGLNKKLDDEYEFLRAPAHQLIKQVFHPLEGL